MAAVDSTMIFVHALPSVSVNFPVDTICLNNGNFTLSGDPSGGVWSGIGVTGNIVDPMVSGTGYDLITYMYTDAN
jgi:hypothetical protein